MQQSRLDNVEEPDRGQRRECHEQEKVELLEVRLSQPVLWSQDILKHLGLEALAILQLDKFLATNKLVSLQGT